MDKLEILKKRMEIAISFDKEGIKALVGIRDSFKYRSSGYKEASMKMSFILGRLADHEETLKLLMEI